MKETPLNQTALILIAIIALVAIVGIVAITTQQPEVKRSVQPQEYPELEEGEKNVVGEPHWRTWDG